ncbi:type 4a pilus biogenesis protein PilO [bacterium]|nr:type 4a pilus biogenesis protein PilO [bacterium]
MKKTFIIPILLFLTLILVTYFLLPQYQKFKNLTDQVEKKRAEFSQKEKYFSNLKQISENLKDYQTSLLKIETALPQDLSLSDLLNFLQKISAENGLLLKNVVQAKESKMEAKGILAKVKETYFNLNLIGSYASLKGFLQALEKSSRLIEVESVFVDETDEGLPKYNISIKVHSL